MAISKAPEWWLQSLSASGKDVVLFDRRGLGASSGEASIQRLRQDSQDKYDFVRQRYQPQQIMVHGFSLGSFIGADLARYRDVDKLVLQGSATDVHDWIDEVIPWYMKAFLNFEIEPAFSEVSNVEAVKGYTGPLLLIAAENDKQAPPVLSQRLLEASQSKEKTLLVVKGADHGSMLKDADTVSAYVKFLNQP